MSCVKVTQDGSARQVRAGTLIILENVPFIQGEIIVKFNVTRVRDWSVHKRSLSILQHTTQTRTKEEHGGSNSGMLNIKLARMGEREVNRNHNFSAGDVAVVIRKVRKVDHLPVMF